MNRPLTGELRRCRADTPIAAIGDALERDGGIVVRGLLSEDVCAALETDLAPFVEARGQGFRPDNPHAFYGGNTRRVQGLANKSATFVSQLLLHPTLLALADRILLPNCGDYWLSQAETIYIGPRSEAQVLHRDDINWEIAARLGIPLQISVLCALGDFDAAAGATMVVPGSHTWAAGRALDSAAASPIEMERGDALVYLGSLVHGGGANTTPDRWRRALYLSYLVGWLTPEEAIAVSLDDDRARRLPARARSLLGRANLRGLHRCDGSRVELELWQLDELDLERRAGAFDHR